MNRCALVLVADSGRARMFSWARGAGGLKELSDLVNPEARLPKHALAADRQGRGFNRQRGSRTALGGDTLRRNSALRFAQQVGAKVSAEVRTQRAARLFILAEAEFLGLLRGALRTRRIAVPVSMIVKNLTRADVRRIRMYLPKYLERIA